MSTRNDSGGVARPLMVTLTIPDQRSADFQTLQSVWFDVQQMWHRKADVSRSRPTKVKGWSNYNEKNRFQLMLVRGVEDSPVLSLPKKLRAVVVREVGTRGQRKAHLHVLCWSPALAAWLVRAWWLATRERFGRSGLAYFDEKFLASSSVDSDVVEDVERLAAYVAKYVSKGVEGESVPLGTRLVSALGGAKLHLTRKSRLKTRLFDWGAGAGCLAVGRTPPPTFDPEQSRENAAFYFSPDGPEGRAKINGGENDADGLRRLYAGCDSYWRTYAAKVFRTTPEGLRFKDDPWFYLSPKEAKEVVLMVARGAGPCDISTTFFPSLADELDSLDRGFLAGALYECIVSLDRFAPRGIVPTYDRRIQFREFVRCTLNL